MLGMHDQGQLIFQDFRGQKLGIAWHEGNRAEIQEVDQALRIVLQKGSRIGEADRSRAPDEERLAEGVLELTDGQADGGLGTVKALGGAREAALLRHHQKYLQFAEVQGALPVGQYKVKLSKVEQR